MPQKRSVSGKEVLNRIRSGVTAAEIRDRFNLTPEALERVLANLMSTGRLKQPEYDLWRAKINISGLLKDLKSGMNSKAVRQKHGLSTPELKAAIFKLEQAGYLKLAKPASPTDQAGKEVPPQIVQPRPEAGTEPVVRGPSVSLASDPTLLRDFIKRSLQADRNGGLTARQLEALAEAYFRVAVHRETKGHEALQLLKSASKLDGTNPKYGYHIARLFYVHGDLDRAAFWLQKAIRMCPTSHRIWSHAYLLHLELNLRYYGDKNYEPNALKERGDNIKTHVKDGKDNITWGLLDFAPPLSTAAKEKRARQEASQTAPTRRCAGDSEGAEAQNCLAEGPDTEARRMINPNQCRWSGIYDLEMESLLEAEPSNMSLQRLLPLLEHVATQARKSPGRATALAILALEWLVAGYPVSTIRGLSRTLTGENRSTQELLDLACRLYEVAEEDVPPLLAQALQQNRIPVFVAAMIHNHRLLWRPLDFNACAKYRSACELTALHGRNDPGSLTEEELEKTARSCISALEGGIKLLNPPLPEPLAAPAAQPRKTALSDQEAQEQFVSLETVCRDLQTVHGQTFDFTKQNLDPLAKKIADESDLSRAAADQQAVEEILKAFADAAEIGANTLNVLIANVAGLSATAMGPDFEDRKNTCLNILRDLGARGRFDKVMKRIKGKIQAAEKNFKKDDAQLPSPELTQLSTRLEELKSSLSPEDTQDPASQSAAGPIKACFAEARPLASGAPKMLLRLRRLIEAQQAGSLGESGESELNDLSVFAAELGAFAQKASPLVSSMSNGAADDEWTYPLAVIESLAGKAEPFQRQLDNFARGGRSAAGHAAPEKPGSAPCDHETGALSTRASLRQSVAHVDAELECQFQLAEQTFAPYSPGTLVSPPFRLLLDNLLERKAELLYRLGRRTDAKRAWNRLLREDRLHIPSLKNLAVSEARDPDASRSLNAWANYMELLYSYAIISGDARLQARARTEFHRDFGNAYAPVYLISKQERQKEPAKDELACLSFFNSAAAVRSFVDHKLLETLNAKLAFKTPSLILGVARSEGARVREDARAKLDVFADECSNLLPPRVADHFRHLCHKHVQAALDACTHVEGLTLKKNPSYAEEEDRQIRWVKSIADLKVKLYVAATSFKELPARLSSIAFLAELRRLNAIPLDLSPSILESVAKSYGASDSQRFLKLTDDFSEYLLHSLVTFIFNDEDNAGTAEQRNVQYRRLVTGWVKDPSLESYVSIINDPQQFYSDEVKFVVSNDIDPKKAERSERARFDKAVTDLKTWCERYPELTGPACHLAVLLFKDGKTGEAIAVLETARSRGFHAEGKDQCSTLLTQLRRQQAMESGDPEAAMQAVKEQCVEDPDNLKLLEELASLYVESISQAEKNADVASRFVGKVARDFDWWLSLSKQARGPDVRNQVSDWKRKLMMRAATLHLSEQNEDRDWSQWAQAAQSVLALDSGNMEAVHLLMGSRFRQAVVLSDSGEDSSPTGRERLLALVREADALATRLLAESTDQEQLRSAATVKQQAEQVLAGI